MATNEPRDTDLRPKGHTLACVWFGLHDERCDALCDSQADWDRIDGVMWEDSVEEETDCWPLLDVAGTVALLRALS